MGDYTARMAAMQVLRNPFDDEEAARQKERNIFGNRYRRMEKTLKIDEQDDDRGIEYQYNIEDVRPRISPPSSRPSHLRLSISGLESPLSSRPLSSDTPLPLPSLCTWYRGTVVTPIPKVLPWKDSRDNETGVRKYYTDIFESATNRFNSTWTGDSVVRDLDEISSMTGVIESRPQSIEQEEVITGSIYNPDIQDEAIGENNYPPPNGSYNLKSNFSHIISDGKYLCIISVMH